MTQDATKTSFERDTKTATLRGLKHTCPKCGEGSLFTSYLKVTDTCALCQEPLYHHRADDGPAYLTILIVGHIMGVLLHATYGYLKDDPLILALSLCAVAILLSLSLLPRVKGMMVGYQWAKKMHGFGWDQDARS